MIDEYLNCTQASQKGKQRARHQVHAPTTLFFCFFSSSFSVLLINLE